MGLTNECEEVRKALEVMTYPGWGKECEDSRADKRERWLGKMKNMKISMIGLKIMLVADNERNVRFGLTLFY